MAIVKRFFLVACLLAVATSAIAAGPGDGIRETRLPNGLTILTKEVRVAPVVSVNVFYKVGSRNEHTGITGVSHLLEHMMFKGSKAFPKGTLESMVRQRGGILNAATSVDYTYYWELLQSDYLEMALKIEADRMSNALFKAEDLISEMPVVRSELEGGENSPDTLLWNLVNATAFTAHPYQWPIIGWRVDVEGMTRDQIYNYYRTHYGPNNATVVIVGDFETAKAIELVRKYFGTLKPIAKPREVYTQEPAQRGERRSILRQAGSAERALIGFKTPAANSPDTFSLDILEQVLSGGRASRLYQSLVESGLATEAWAYNSSKIDPSLFYLGATAQSGKTADELEKALLAEVEKIKADGPSQAEIDRAKRQIEAAFIFNNEDVRSQALLIGRFASMYGWRDLNNYLPGIEKVTAEDVRRVASKYLVVAQKTVGHFIPEGAAPEMPAAPVGAEAGYRPGQSAEAVTSSAVSTASTGTRTKISPVRMDLPNGIILLVLNNPANPSISISGSLNAGSYHSPSNREIADLTADMLSRGTKTKSSLQFAEGLEDLGASLSFRSTVEAAWFDGKTLSRDFETWVNLLADALRNPAFSEAELEKLKTETVSAILQQKESTDVVAETAFLNKVFPDGHPYRPGTLDQQAQSAKSASSEGIRQFHQKQYGPAGMIISIVGDITPDAAKAAIEKAFSDWEKQPSIAKVNIPDAPPVVSSEEWIKVPDKTETTIIYGWPGDLTRSSPDFYAANVMNDILGGGSVMTSRLGKTIRGKMGLVYDVNSGFRATLGAGPWIAALGTNPSNATKAIEALKAEVNRMRQEGPTEAEVKESTQYIAGVLSLRMSTNSGIASMLLNAEFYGLGMDYLSNFRQIYSSVTPQQVKVAADRYLRPDWATLVVAGPDEKP